MIKKIYLLILLCGITFAAEHTTEQPLKVLVVGLGDHMTGNLLQAINPQQFKVVYGSRRTTDELEKQKEELCLEHVSTDYKTILDNHQVDAVFVAGPQSLHEQVVEECINRGVPVFVEKPLSMELATSKRLMELAEKKKSIVSVGYNMMYLDGFMTKEVGNSRVIANCSVGEPLSKGDSFEKVVKEGIYFASVHPLSTIYWLFGKTNDMNVIFYNEPEPNKFELQVELRYASKSNPTIIFKNCEDGGFHFNISRITKYDYMTINVKRDQDGKTIKQISYEKELNAFYQAIKSDKPTRSDLKANFEIHQMLDQIEKDVFVKLET